MLLRQLDVTFPHGDRRRAEIDEQRAVRAEAARAAGGGRAKLATLQPVACREGGALALAERRVARREPRERGHEAIQDIEPADRGEPFPESHRAMRDRRGNGVAHIHAHTDRQPLQSLAVPTALAEDARELALPQQHVVGPFETGLEPAEEGIDRIRDGEPDAYRDHPQLGARRTEQHADPDAARRGVPRATVTSPSRGLLFGDHHRPRKGALRAEVVNGVEGRAELAKQAALRHAPPPGEIGCRHAVEGQPCHRAYASVNTPTAQQYGANAWKRPRCSSATSHRIDQMPLANATRKLTAHGTAPTAATLSTA